MISHPGSIVLDSWKSQTGDFGLYHRFRDSNITRRNKIILNIIYMRAINLTDRWYDLNKYVLVVNLEDYRRDSVGDGFFLIPKDEWLSTSTEGTFQVILTDIVNERMIRPLINKSTGEPFVFKVCQMEDKREYLAV